jgi:hypothetical protein
MSELISRETVLGAAWNAHPAKPHAKREEENDRNRRETRRERRAEEMSK